MAIDYKVEWEKLSSMYGCCGVNIPHEAVSVTLRSIMENQIADTISEREKLMEEFIKQKMTTSIGKQDKLCYYVDLVINKGIFGRFGISRKDFDKWLKEWKGGK